METGLHIYKNFAIFVKKAKKGDRDTKIKISSVADRFAIAEIAPAPASATATTNSTSQA